MIAYLIVPRLVIQDNREGGKQKVSDFPKVVQREAFYCH